MTALRAWIPGTWSACFQEALRSALDDAAPGVVCAWGDDVPEEPCEVLVAGVPTDAQLDAHPTLKTVVVPWSGIGATTRERLLARPQLAAANLHHNAPAVAELALGLLLAVARRIVPFDRALRAGDWTPRYEPDPSLSLVGRTALVLGYGAIGRRVGRALAALDMHVLAVARRAPAGDDLVGEPHAVDALDDLLPRAQVLIVALPLTSASRGLVDAARLDRLPQGALVVNVARGPVIDEGALYDALLSGHLGGAGLDVWWRYPRSEDARSTTAPSVHPFDALDTVVFSPHRGGHAADVDAVRAQALADTLLRLARGQPPEHPVDLLAGY